MIYSGSLRLVVLPFFFFLASLVGFVTLSFRVVGVDFEELHLRLVFSFVESGSMNFPNFCIYGSSEWASVRVLFLMRSKGR